MRSNCFQQSIRDRHYQRLSTTLIINAEKPVTLQVDDLPPEECHIALLSANSRRQHMAFNGGDGFLFDIDITSDACARLRSTLPLRGLGKPAPRIAAGLLDMVAGMRDTPLSADTAVAFYQDIIDTLTAECPPARPRDVRIQKILRSIEQTHREELSVASLARAVNLSQPRLRSLVQKELGCSPVSYLRWAMAWKTAELWRPGITITEVAHAAGFHDLSHANRTFVELFGLSPTRFLKSDQIRMERCHTA